MEWLNTLPPWVGLVGWVALLVGYLLQRQAMRNTVHQSNKAWVAGSGNTTLQTNNANGQVAPPSGQPPANGQDSALGQAGSWASIVGLGLSLLPFLKTYLAQ